MKDKYEISLWEDYLVEASGNVPAHFEERKLCVIGSNTMTDSFRAYNPVLTSDINGTHTFTFKMYYIIKENEITVGESGFEAKSGKNPFLNLLVNERKVKVFWKDEWYDFVIKNCQEDSSGKSITYTCSDVFVNELSKNGFNIVLDDELENNCGTVLELAQTVLDGTDWNLDSDNSDIIQQKKEEPVYEVNTLRNWTLTDQTIQQEATILADKKVLVYYQQVQDILNYLEENELSSVVDDVQVAYADNYERDTNSQLVTNADCYSMTAKWTKTQLNGVDCLEVGPDLSGDPYIRIFYNSVVSANYRAERLVKHLVSKLDALTGKYCNVYTVKEGATIPTQYQDLIHADDEIYKYQATEWNDAIIVNNLTVNPKDFITEKGWVGDENLIFQLYPSYSSVEHIESYTAKSYLHFSNGIDFYNAGISQNASFAPDGFAIGETYIFRYKAMGNTGTPKRPDGTYINTGITPSICTYKDEDNTKKIDTDGPVYFDVSSLARNGDWVEFRLTCKKSITRGEFSSKKIALFLTTSVECWLEEVQLFKEVYGASNTRINPGDIDVQSVASVKYVYFNHTTSQGLLSADDINPLWSSTTDWNCSAFLEAQYNKDFEKIRSISGKQSNRFNLIQTIAETFECWAQFVINHDSTGRVIYNEDGTPQKYVRFKNEIGQNTGIGFIYGIDLRTISRTIQSDQIVTKTIVSPNSNEFAEKGFCTIARSKENYPRTSFLLNFDYYINQGLIDGGALNRDLYDPTNGIGYFYYLHQYNTEYDKNAEFLDAKRLELTKQASYQTVYNGTITSLQENIANLRAYFIGLANASSWDGATQYIKKNADIKEVSSQMTALKTAEESLATYQSMASNLNDSIAQLQAAIEAKEAEQEEIVERIEALDLQFYKKYSRFIQEGSWTSEDYIDDNLYYLDAQSVAYTSSRPQISYDISVLRISGIEEFKNKVFRLGDISFIQDPEFFGYVYINGIKTPYKEKVLISEVVSNFDEPEKDSFKVQNYKTQFEDLFQRITSTTQSLQYASGGYARAAAAIEPTGTINAETLQNSISLNEQLVFSAQNESVVSDSTGITVSDTENPNKKTKITSGGLFISTDGGSTWKNAVRGEGISTQYLTAGSINANEINIMDGNFRTFRWDQTGINAYYNLGSNYGINLSKFVRFDHFGIYGIERPGEENYIPTSETDIWNDAKFGMTWNGFFVKNKYGGHYVEVSSTDDIRVVKTPEGSSPVELIKIGALDSNNTVFGIRISDDGGAPVMESDNTGKLWLRDRLNISSTEDEYNIGVGYLDGYKPGYPDIHEVFNANDAFLVYEDGSIKATSGTIGTMTIEKIERAYYEIVCDKEKISKYYPDGANELAYTPEDIIFRVYGPDQDAPVSLNDYTVQINVIGFATVSPDNANFIIDESGLYIVSENNENIVSEDTPESGEVNIDVLELLHKLTGKFLRVDEHGDPIYDEHDEPIYDYINLKTKLYIEDGNYDTISLKIEDMFSCDVAYEGTAQHPANAEKDIELFETLLQIISEDNIAEFEILVSIQNKDISLNKIIPIEFGLTDSMAKFILSAEAISMLINNTKLVFTEEGLNVYNGGFVIYGKDIDAETQQEIEVPIFYYDPGENQLHVKGSGEFTGTIHATEGSFTGDVSANTLISNKGYIGSFIIRNDGLYSTEGAVLDENNEYDVTGSKLKLLGGDGAGLIEADNINLGTGAHINHYIKIGNNCFIHNPDEYAGNFIEVLHDGVDAISLNENGVMKIGQLTLDGKDSIIYGNSFSITPDVANFSNVTVSGKISTAVFEKGHVQSVGGILMFKPAYNIESYSGKTIVLDSKYTGSIGNYVYLVNEDGNLLNGLMKVDTISSDYKTITLTTDAVSETKLVSLIDIGVENDLVIGVNSTDVRTSFLQPRGITISEFKLNSGKTQTIEEQTNPKVFLGDLDKSGIDFSGISAAYKQTRGFGLFAENVYLTGALTTRIDTVGGNSSFAGMNTLDGVHANKFKDDEGHLTDTSAIVFWAGANSVDEKAIQDAYFQVTEQGSIYAARAKFTDSIITDAGIYGSSLHGADIYTARIHGNGDKDGEGLSFYDTSKGIKFFRGEYGDTSPAPSEVFSLGTDGLKKGDDYFISITNNGVDFSGKNYYTDRTQSSYIHLKNNSIIGARLNENKQEVEVSKILFDNTGINLISQERKVVLNAPNVQIGNTIYFGNQMMYEQLGTGYNLYVLS